jgi:hypothetical protein
MKKAMVVILIIVSGISGWLYYDWHIKTAKQAAEPSVPQYSWTDAQGHRHFTDSRPPKGATNIKETRGYEYIKPALVVTIKDNIVKYYDQIKEKLLEPQKKKKRKRKY